MIKNKETGVITRPGTGHTVEAWFNTNPSSKIKKCLAISNNPYIPYQYQSMYNILNKKGFLRHGVILETVGSSADPSTSLAVHLDNVGQWLKKELHSEE